MANPLLALEEPCLPSDLTGEGHTSQRTILVEPAGPPSIELLLHRNLGGRWSLLIAGFVLHPIYGLLLALALARPAFRQHTRATHYRKGIVGEELVSTLLAGLPDDFYLINDVTLPGHRGNIDHVLVGPCGVVVIETKNYRGVIKCDQDEWFVDGRRIEEYLQPGNTGRNGRKRAPKRSIRGVPNFKIEMGRGRRSVHESPLPPRDQSPRPHHHSLLRIARPDCRKGKTASLGRPPNASESPQRSLKRHVEARHAVARLYPREIMD